jgi:hypothetical protein
VEKSLIVKGVFALLKEQAIRQNRPFLPQIQARLPPFSGRAAGLPTYPSFCTHFVDNVVSKT